MLSGAPEARSRRTKSERDGASFDYGAARLRSVDKAALAPAQDDELRLDDKCFENAESTDRRRAEGNTSSNRQTTKRSSSRDSSPKRCAYFPVAK